MLTLLTLVLWFTGLAGLLHGELFLGGVTVLAAIYTSAKALNRPDDMESFVGGAFGLIVIGSVVIAATEAWRAWA